VRDLTLFDESSTSLESPMFYVDPGWFGVLTAFGFSPVPVSVDADSAKTTQRACVKVVHFDYEIDRGDAPCGVLRDLPRAVVTAMRETLAVTRGRVWQLSACDTVALIDVPGVYRLTLNDPTAVGTVAIILRAMTADDVPRQSALFFGE
jgi:hypothetical protein